MSPTAISASSKAVTNTPGTINSFMSILVSRRVEKYALVFCGEFNKIHRL